jgi:hypothetical protein
MMIQTTLVSEHWPRTGMPRAVSVLGRSRRSGISVLEVLFATGIATVGLLGVLLIIPLAGLRVARGTMADSGDRLGRNAVRQIDAHYMRTPKMWAYYDPNTKSYYDPTAYFDLSAGGGKRLDDVGTHGSFCIDPRMLTRHEVTGALLLRWFPGVTAANSAARMRRVSLRWNFNDLRFNGTNPVLIPDPDNTNRARQQVRGITLGHADRVFMGEDDLVFNLPQDRTGLPQQNFNASTNPKRQSQGAFSWMATLTPKVGSANDLYILSVVVFHRRIPELTEERICDVTFGSNGVNGGEVTLSGANDDLKMKEGEWLMLAGLDTAPNPDVEYFHWYQIQSADAGPSNSTRELTLFGQDWPVGNVSNPKAVWVPGTIAVYEKTIRLETSSLWTPP